MPRENCWSTADAHSTDFDLLVGVEHAHLNHLIIARPKLLPLFLRVSCLFATNPWPDLTLLRVSGGDNPLSISTLHEKLILLFNFTASLMHWGPMISARSADGRPAWVIFARRYLSNHCWTDNSGCKVILSLIHAILCIHWQVSETILDVHVLQRRSLIFRGIVRSERWCALEEWNSSAVSVILIPSGFISLTGEIYWAFGHVNLWDIVRSGCVIHRD